MMISAGSMVPASSASRHRASPAGRLRVAIAAATRADRRGSAIEVTADLRPVPPLHVTFPDVSDRLNADCVYVLRRVEDLEAAESCRQRAEALPPVLER